MAKRTGGADSLRDEFAQYKEAQQGGSGYGHRMDVRMDVKSKPINTRQATPVAQPTMTRQAYDRRTGRPVARTQKAAPQKPVYVKGNKRIK